MESRKESIPGAGQGDVKLAQPQLPKEPDAASKQDAKRFTYRKYLLYRFRSAFRARWTPFVRKMRSKSILRRERYIFTDKKHPEQGLFSFALGLIGIISLGAAVKLSFDRGGEALFSYALAVWLAFAFCVTGLVFGIVARRRRDIFTLFPNLGILLNCLTILLIAGVFCLGVL